MEKLHEVFDFYPDVKFWVLVIALVLLSIPDIVRFRIRSYVDEWAMGLISKKNRRRRR